MKTCPSDTKDPLANIVELLETESLPDCRLITKEQILIETHKIVLFQSLYLRSLITSVSCNDGKCPVQEPVTLIMPDISFRHLDPILLYLYTGNLQCPASDKSVIMNLLRMFQISQDRECVTLSHADNDSSDCVLDDQENTTTVIMKQVEDICHPEVKSSNQITFNQDIQPEDENTVITDEKYELISFVNDNVEEEDHNKDVSAKESEDRNVLAYQSLEHFFSSFEKGDKKPKQLVIRIPRNFKIEMECLICGQIVRGNFNFKRHLVWTHLHPLWTEVRSDEICCQDSDCGFMAANRRMLIWHLAMKHKQFELKLAERNQTISNYGMPLVANTK